VGDHMLLVQDKVPDVLGQRVGAWQRRPLGQHWEEDTQGRVWSGIQAVAQPLSL
jgi:hypothetical protein